MQIGIIGTGNVGGTLGTRWAQGGHDVVSGSRRPQSAEVRALIEKSGNRARTNSGRAARCFSRPGCPN
jgi:8-hydroxy-5-deazaflavin:NADPH oxidoreductase